MAFKGSNGVAVERRVDLASLFCMIGRHGPAVALAVFAMVSVLAGFVIYRTVRGRRRKKKTTAGDADRAEGKSPPAETDETVTQAGPEPQACAASTDVGDVAKEEDDSTGTPLQVRRRAAAAEKSLPPCVPDVQEPDTQHATSPHTQGVESVTSSFTDAQMYLEEPSQSLQSMVAQILLEPATVCHLYTTDDTFKGKGILKEPEPLKEHTCHEEVYNGELEEDLAVTTDDDAEHKQDIAVTTDEANSDKNATQDENTQPSSSKQVHFEQTLPMRDDHDKQDHKTTTETGTVELIMKEHVTSTKSPKDDFVKVIPLQDGADPRLYAYHHFPSAVEKEAVISEEQEKEPTDYLAPEVETKAVISDEQKEELPDLFAPAVKKKAVISDEQKEELPDPFAPAVEKKAVISDEQKEELPDPFAPAVEKEAVISEEQEEEPTDYLAPEVETKAVISEEQEEEPTDYLAPEVETKAVISEEQEEEPTDYLAPEVETKAVISEEQEEEPTDYLAPEVETKAVISEEQEEEPPDYLAPEVETKAVISEEQEEEPTDYLAPEVEMKAVISEEQEEEPTDYLAPEVETKAVISDEQKEELPDLFAPAVEKKAVISDEQKEELPYHLAPAVEMEAAISEEEEEEPTDYLGPEVEKKAVISEELEQEITVETTAADLDGLRNTAVDFDPEILAEPEEEHSLTSYQEMDLLPGEGALVESCNIVDSNDVPGINSEAAPQIDSVSNMSTNDQQVQKEDFATVEDVTKNLSGITEEDATLAEDEVPVLSSPGDHQSDEELDIALKKAEVAIIPEDQYDDNTESSKNLEEPMFESAGDVDAGDEASHEDTSSSAQNQQNECKVEDFSFVFTAPPVKIEDLSNPSKLQICLPVFEPSELRDSNICSGGGGEESGISSMAVSPESLDPTDHEARLEPQTCLFPDDRSVLEKDAVVYEPHPAPLPDQPFSQISECTNVEVKKDSLIGHVTEEGDQRETEKSPVPVQSDERERRVDVEVAEKLECKDKKEPELEKDEDYVKTEINIMEATMDHNEWITDSSPNFPWMNLSVPSFGGENHAATQKLPTQESEPPSVPQIQQTDGCDLKENESKKVKVTFRVHYLTHSPYQKLAVTGNRRELGNWKEFISLESSQDGYWAAVVSLPAGKRVQWKFVVVERGEACRWEECGNRLLSTGCSQDLFVQKLWGFH